MIAARLSSALSKEMGPFRSRRCHMPPDSYASTKYAPLGSARSGIERSILGERMLSQAHPERRVRPMDADSRHGGHLVELALGRAHRSRAGRGATIALPGNPHCTRQHIPTSNKKLATVPIINPAFHRSWRSRARKTVSARGRIELVPAGPA
jgi:hypothetical protein